MFVLGGTCCHVHQNLLLVMPLLVSIPIPLYIPQLQMQQSIRQFAASPFWFQRHVTPCCATEHSAAVYESSAVVKPCRWSLRSADALRLAAGSGAWKGLLDGFDGRV